MLVGQQKIMKSIVFNENQVTKNCKFIGSMIENSDFPNICESEMYLRPYEKSISNEAFLQK